MPTKVLTPVERLMLSNQLAIMRILVRDNPAIDRTAEFLAMSDRAANAREFATRRCED